MILVDIYIPVIDKTYDFQLDENTSVDNVIIELAGIIDKKMKSEEKSLIDGFELYDLARKSIISKEETLYIAGVRDGSRLMLL